MKNRTATFRKSPSAKLSYFCQTDRFVTAIALFIIFSVTCNVNVYAQSFRYKFQVEGVTDMATAKDITDPLRTLFNTVDEPFRFYPTFNDERNEFDFRADIDISKDILFGLLTDHALILTSFVRYSLETPHRFE